MANSHQESLCQPKIKIEPEEGHPSINRLIDYEIKECKKSLKKLTQFTIDLEDRVNVG